MISRVQREVDRSLKRIRNGVRYVTGSVKPEIAQTYRNVVWREGKAELWHYPLPDGATADRDPIVVVHSLVTRSYVFDLTPDNSMVRFLHGQGHEVFVVSWGEPEAIDADNDLVTYSDELLPAIIDAARASTGAEQVAVLGYCLGGLISLLHAARNPDTPVSAMVLVATPLEVGDLGAMGSILKAARRDASALLDETGNVPPDTVRNAFRLLQPTADVIGVVNLVQFGWNDAYLDMHRAMTIWANDHIPLPGGCVRDMSAIADDRPTQTGRLTVRGETVDLADVRLPLLVVLGDNDELVPRSASGDLLGLVGSTDAEELRLASGHLGLLLGTVAHRRNLPAITAWLQPRVTRTADQDA